MRLGANSRTALGNMAAKAFSVPFEKIFRFAMLAVAARALKEEAFGRFQFADTVAALLVLGTDLGLGIWTTRALARGEPGRAPAIVGTGLWVRGLAAVPYFALVGGVALAVGAGDTRGALLFLGVSALGGALVEYCGSVFRGYERLRDEARLNVVRAVLVALGGLSALAWRRSVGALAAGVMVGSVAAAGTGITMLRRRYRLPTPLGGAAFDARLARAAIREALPLWLATLMSLVYFKGDAVLLRLFAGDAAVGSYSAAYKIFEATMILPSIVLAASFPTLVRAHDQDSSQRRRSEVGLGTALLGLGTLVGGVVFLASGLAIRLAFGPAFANAVPALRVLAFAVPLVFLNYGLTHFLIARRLERYNLAFTIVMVVLNLTANLMLIPRFAGLGAAWTTVGTEVALTACCLATLGWAPRALGCPSRPPAGRSATSKVRTSE
jgi:O-antigen/teichoic acid export membrane protein